MTLNTFPITRLIFAVRFRLRWGPPQEQRMRAGSVDPTRPRRTVRTPHVSSSSRSCAHRSGDARGLEPCSGSVPRRLHCLRVAVHDGIRDHSAPTRTGAARERWVTLLLAAAPRPRGDGGAARRLLASAAGRLSSRRSGSRLPGCPRGGTPRHDARRRRAPGRAPRPCRTWRRADRDCGNRGRDELCSARAALGSARAFDTASPWAWRSRRTRCGMTTR